MDVALVHDEDDGDGEQAGEQGNDKDEAGGDFAPNFVSASIFPMLGYRPDEYLKDADFWRSHVHPEDLPEVEAKQAELFEKGEHVDIQGVTKGRGFAGVVKRHKFVAGHASHGPTAGKQPGSIGASAYPSRVIKGKRLPGRMGGVNLTTKNLEVVAVDPEQGVLIVRGAVPGPVNGLVFIMKREVR